jgi:hypothetical protein
VPAPPPRSATPAGTSSGTPQTAPSAPRSTPGTYVLTLIPASPITARVDTTAQCQAASHAGELEAGPTFENAGGPNTVPDPCTAIWLRLTDVYYITYAKACLENSHNVETQCGDWIYLEDGGAWNELLDGVTPGQHWVLHLKAEGQEHVGFVFSG